MDRRPTPPSADIAGVRSLIRWVWPFVMPYRRMLIASLGLSAVALATQSGIPYVVKSVLGGNVQAMLITTLLGLVVVDLITNFGASRTGAYVAAKSTERLRTVMFGRVLDTTVLDQSGVRRTTTVSRHSQDADRVEHAVDYTLAEGLPALVSVAVSLVLLTTIDRLAGVLMFCAVIVFFLVRMRIARRSLAVEYQRQDASAGLEAVVDEAIGASRGVTGLGLQVWVTRRFHRSASDLDHLTLELFRYNSWLLFFARLAGLAGLTAVILVGIWRGTGDLATIAAALLYVEYVVSGLDKLRLWLLYVHSGLVSKRRIDDLLLAQERIPGQVSEASPTGESSVCLRSATIEQLGAPLLVDVNLEIPGGSVTALVAPTWVDPDLLLAVLAGDASATSGCVHIAGADARLPINRRRTLLVPAEATAFDVSTRELIHAGNPDLDDAAIHALLASVGLDHLANLPAGGLDAPLGLAGRRLTPTERQLLLLAVALAADPDVLLVSSLVAFTDADALTGLFAAMSRPARTIVLAAGTADVADLAERVVFIHDAGAIVGPHRQLLVEYPAYAEHWETEVRDLDDLLLERAGVRDAEHLRARLVTEHFALGDMLVRPGSLANSVSVIVSGRVEVVADPDSTAPRRVAVLGPGAVVGDISEGAASLEAVNALEPTVVRTLNRSMADAGITGMLDLPGPERIVLTSLLRDGPGTTSELAGRLTALPAYRVESALKSLAADSAIRADDTGRWSITQRRKSRSGTADLLDLLE
jgi:ABC-type multidrug transport system fused ATPase/permease subunit